MIIHPKRHIFGTIYRPYEGYYKVKYRPVNREQKRELGQEMVKVIEHLLEIEFNFLNWLFASEVEIEYEIAYQVSLDKYKETCEWLKQKYNFKWLTIDTYYFENEYKPIENL